MMRTLVALAAVAAASAFAPGAMTGLRLKSAAAVSRRPATSPKMSLDAIEGAQQLLSVAQNVPFVDEVTGEPQGFTAPLNHFASVIGLWVLFALPVWSAAYKQAGCDTPSWFGVSQVAEDAPGIGLVAKAAPVYDGPSFREGLEYTLSFFGKHLDFGEDKELVLLVVDCALVAGTTEGLVEGGDDGVAGGVHCVAVKVSAGLPRDEDGGLPEEGERVLQTLAEGRAVVDGGGLGHQTDARGILGNLRDAEPRGGVAAGLLVGRRPHREGEQNPEAEHRGEVVERCGEALRLAGDLVHERNVLRDSQELLGALDGVKRHLGRGRRAPGHSRSALEAQASHGAGREGGSRSNSGERDQSAHH